ncbi:MAG: TolC family protein, partial [Sulfuritalea sp.]|nr:TolC family protein [Sulfuritalea sp.]
LPLLLATALAVAGGAASASESVAIGGNVESLLAFARERHPEYAALRHEAEAAEARVAPAAALPDPMFGVELRDFLTPASGPNLLPARVGSTRYTLSQTLPWFGKRDLRRAIAAAGADAARGQLAVGWAELAWQIKQVYAEHYLHQASLRLGRENLELLGQIEQIAQARYAGGLAAQQDVIRAQTERTALSAELAMLEGESQQSSARMRSLMGGLAGATLRPPERLRNLPPLAQLDAAALEARLVERSPRLAADAARIAAAEKNRALTWRNRYPDVTVGLAAMQERSRVTGYDLMFEVNIPLQRASRRAQEREAARLHDATLARREATLNQLRAEVSESLTGIQAARRVAELASGSLLPQAELTLQAALTGYETGQVDFAAVLDAQRQIRRTKEELVRARVLQEQRRADIERTIGEEL